MECRPERIVDYFVIVGLGKTVSPFKVELVEEVGEGSLKLAPPTNLSPITEIGLVCKKNENVPKGFKCIETTVGGHNASLTSHGLFGTSLYLCYRQGGDKPPITEISIYNAENSKHFPDGHETIAVTVDGRSGDLSGGGRYPIYLTVKRGFTHGYNSSTAITKLCVIDGKEERPIGFKSLPITLSRGLMSSGIRICYRTNLICPPSLAYTAEIISRYPTADQKEFPLPESVPLFCLPFGVSVEAWNRRTPFPLPTFSTFALTSALGKCMYGACVVFYEQVPDNPSLKDMRRELKVNDDTMLYMSKCICLLSHWPFFAAFKDFLSSLYRLSISQNNTLPLERYIANLFDDVPFPTPRRPRVQMQIGPESIVFSLPIRTPLPMGVTTHWTLLSCLDVDHCITILHLVLLEQKIVLHSHRPALLTSIGEAMRSILFPLQWQCTYIPMCPLAFASYLQAPVPFIIGMDSRYFESFSAPPEVCVLDLDADTLIMGSYAKQHLCDNPLPQKLVRLLRKNLLMLANEVSSLSFGGDFAVEVAPMNFEDSIKLQQERIDVNVREIFLRFISSLLSNYRSCLRPLMSKPNFRYQDISDLFDIDLFLKQKHSSEKQFYKTFLDTQTFTSFIEQRSFAHSESTTLAFFDECTEKIVSDQNAKLLNIDEILSKRYDLPTVVTPPPDESGLIQGKRYSYQTFPSLDPTLFHSPLKRDKTSSVSSKDYKEISQAALVNMAVRTQAERTKSKSLVERAAGSDALWSKVLLSHSCCMWYMLLSHHLRSQWNKFEVLSQALELLEVLRTKQALPSDEVCYRALMEQCVQLGKPALAVKVYSAIQKAGIHPSAVTYGFYNKALLDKEWPSVKRRWNVLKIVFYACFYLRYLRQESIKTGRKSSIISMEEREANFQFLRRSSSHYNELSITALDIGIEGVEEMSLMNTGGRCGSGGKISKGSVYRLNPASSASKSRDGDYAFRDDSFYIADKSPLLKDGKGRLGSGFLNQGRTVSVGSSSSESLKSEDGGARVEVCLCSSVQCPSCKSLLYDEEIMACWSEEVDEYNINCSYCYKSLVPSLTIKIKKLIPVESGGSTAPVVPSTVEGTIKEESSDLTNTSSSISLDPSSPSSVSLDPSNLSSTSLDPSPLKEIPSSDRSNRDETDGIFKTTLPHSDPVPRKTLSLGKYSNGSHNSDDEDKQLSKLKVMNRSKTLSSSDEDDSRIKTTYTLPRQSHSNAVEQTDSSIREYIALMRKRGHKRTASAPVPSPPLIGRTGGERNWSERNNGEHPLTNAAFQTNLANRVSFEEVEQEPFIVPYLNPVVLRKELESLLTQGKSFMLSSESFPVEKSILYWNLVWYFTRLKLPTYLPLLLLRKVVKDHPHLKKPGVRMQVETIWDSKFPGVNDPLYMIWLGAASGTIVASPSMASRKVARRNSAMQLQPLVARIQCGDFLFVLRSILDDRKEQELQRSVGDKPGIMETSLSIPLLHRSAYRQLLFLKLSLYPETFDIDLFDKEYQLCLQRLPKESAILLQSWDYPPTAKACHCRKEFGLLKVL